MAAVGLATILLSLVLVRSLMVKRLSQLTGQLLSLRRDTLGGRRLRVDRGPLGQRDEISVLAEEFDTLLGALAATTRQDRKSVVEGKSVAVRVGLGGSRIIKKKKEHIKIRSKKNK